MHSLTPKPSLTAKVLLPVICLGLASTASAQQTNTNSTGSGDWSNAGVWSHGVPKVNDTGMGNGNTATIRNGNVITLEGESGEVNEVRINTGTLRVGSGGVLALSVAPTAGQIVMAGADNSAALEVVNGGRVQTDSHLTIGNGTNATAIVTVGTGSTLAIGNNLRVGSQGNAANGSTTKLILSGGGYTVTSTSTFTVGNSAALNGATALLSVSGTGGVIQSNGQFVFNANATLEFNLGVGGVTHLTGAATTGFNIVEGAILNFKLLDGIALSDLPASILLLDATGTTGNSNITGDFTVDWGDLNPAHWELVYSEGRKQLHLNYMIPEPGTYAAIFGAVALGYIAVRRRRRA